MPIYKKVRKEFFKTWNVDMAYVLGFFAADGNMVRSKRGTHFFSFYSSDKGLICQIKNTMGSEHAISARTSDTGCVYRLQIGSFEMFQDLKELGFCECKADRMTLPIIPKKYVGDFVRGYFDGDGNVWTGYINKKRRTPTHVMQVSFTSASKDFLDGLWKLLKNESIRGGALYTSKKGNFSRLTFSTLDALKLEEIMYNRNPKLYLKRKKFRFEQFKKLRV